VVAYLLVQLDFFSLQLHVGTPNQFGTEFLSRLVSFFFFQQQKQQIIYIYCFFSSTSHHSYYYSFMSFVFLANLNTALTAVKSNMGLAFIAYFVMLLAFGWSCFWFLGFAQSLSTSNTGIVFLLLLSYYWVHQVLSNTIHVTTAGTVGTWYAFEKKFIYA
jgi:hypothetical protein